MARNIYNSVNYGIDFDETLIKDKEIVDNVKNPEKYFRYLYNTTMIFFLINMTFQLLYYIYRFYSFK